MESELLALIDQLEALLAAGGKVPLSSRVMVPAPEVYRLLEQMRQTLPREVARARHIYQERDRILGAARLDAEQTRAAARAERDTLLAEHSVTVEALRAAETLHRNARAEADRLRLEADAYALHRLRDLHIHLLQSRAALDTTLKTVAGGIDHLDAHTIASDPSVAATK